MAHKEYPVDEFDRLAAKRKVRGAHRRPESNRKWWIALVTIIVCAPLIGWGIVQWAGRTAGPAGGSQPTATATQAPQSTASATPAPTESASGSATPEEAEEPAEEPDLATAIQVLNGSTIPGHAAAMQQTLVDAGYTNVGADNYPSAPPAESQIFYPDESYRATALAVADTLGISPDDEHVVEGEGTEGTGVIVVVLAGDLG